MPTDIADAAPRGLATMLPRISWGAVIAGAAVAAATGLALNILGGAIGASTVDLAGRDTPDAGSLGMAGGIWLLVVNLLALGFGGYVAARLSGTADRTDSTLHGLAVWSVGVLIAAFLSGSLLASAAGTLTQGAAQAVGGVAQGAGEAAAVAGPAAQRIDPRQAVERAQAALRSGGDPAAMTSDQRVAEMTGLLGRRIADGSLSPDDRQRLTTLVAAEYQIAPDEAQRRLQAVEAEATEAVRKAEQTAREAGDRAAKGAAMAAYWAFAALLLGALAAVLGARAGTRAWVAPRDRAPRRVTITG